LTARGRKGCGGSSRPPPAVCFIQRRPDAVAPLRAQNLAGVNDYGYRERDGEGDDVWETRRSGVSSMECSGAAFIGQRGLARRWPKVGVRAACAASMAGTTALGACWRVRPHPMVQSCTFRRAGIEQEGARSHGRGPGMGDGKSPAESLEGS
jgi:hypothetical protein